MLTSPPSASSASSAALKTALSLAAASPVWELWASSAMTAKRLPWVAASSRTASSAKGKVWMVQTTIFLPPARASASSPLLLPELPVMTATTPVVRWKSKIASWSWASSTVRSDDHQHAVEDLVVLRVVQVGEEVGGPGDGVGLAGAGRVLDQVLATRTLGQDGDDELAGGVELLVAGEDELLDLLLAVALGDEVAPEDLQPTVARPDRSHR